MANLSCGISVKMWEQNKAKMQEGQRGFHMHFRWWRQMCSHNIYHVVEEETIWNVRMQRANIQVPLHEMHTESQGWQEGSICFMLQLRENWRKRCSHTKEFWVRKGQCALPHVDVLRPKGLTPEILLGPCCLSATRGAVITQMIHSKNHNDFSWVHKNNQKELWREIWTSGLTDTVLSRALQISYRKHRYWHPSFKACLKHWGHLNSGLLCNVLCFFSGIYKTKAWLSPCQFNSTPEMLDMISFLNAAIPECLLPSYLLQSHCYCYTWSPRATLSVRHSTCNEPLVFLFFCFLSLGTCKNLQGNKY